MPESQIILNLLLKPSGKSKAWLIGVDLVDVSASAILYDNGEEHIWT